MSNGAATCRTILRGSAARNRRRKPLALPAHRIAFANAELGGTPAANCEHGSDRLARPDRVQRQRSSGGYPRDRPVCSDEDYVERDERVLHPEPDVLRRI